VRGEVVPGAEPGEDEIGVVTPERRTEGPVAHEHEAKPGALPAHRAVRLDREPDVLLGGEPPDVEDHRVVLHDAP
jgi:hypothetical protein